MDVLEIDASGDSIRSTKTLRELLGEINSYVRSIAREEGELKSDTSDELPSRRNRKRSKST